jgi:EpsI family protein
MTRYAVTLLAIALATAAHVAIRHAQASVAETNPALTSLQLPARVMEYRQAGEDTPVDESIKQVLETSTILMREYLSPQGVPVNLTIVYAGASRRSLHFPEVCLKGQGWEIAEQYAAPVGLQFFGKRLVLAKGGGNQAVLYWFKTGRHLTGNFFLNTFYWARDTLLLRAPSTMMIRLGTPIGSQGEEGAFRVLDDFATALVPILVETIP